jgi:hypothetical protein
MKPKTKPKPPKPLFPQTASGWEEMIRQSRPRQRIRKAEPDWRSEWRSRHAVYREFPPEEMARMLRNFQRSEAGMTLATCVLIEKHDVRHVEERLRTMQDKALITSRIVYDGETYTETWFLCAPPKLEIVSRGTAPLSVDPPPRHPPTTPGKPAA